MTCFCGELKSGLRLADDPVATAQITRLREDLSAPIRSERKEKASLPGHRPPVIREGLFLGLTCGEFQPREI